MEFSWNFQWISLIVFVVVLTTLILIKRKKIDLQKILFPILYVGMYRSNFGLNFIDRFSKKHKEWVRLLGLSGIGIGFAGMVLIVVSIFISVFRLLQQPSASESGVALVLPQTQIPGLGFLPFWYWIIALFVLVVIHEFSHGIVAKANGIKVQKSGVGFFAFILPIIPIAFVEPKEDKMEKAPDHVQYSIFAAGPFSNIISAGIILLLFVVFFSPVESMMTENDGVEFDKINESFPAYSLPDNYTIRSVNGEEVNNKEELMSKIRFIQPGQNLTLGNGTTNSSLAAVESPYGEGGFIGIRNIQDKVVIKEGVNDVTFGVFSWFKGLFKWIGLLSFFIGLANLLPLGPVDGGRMLRTFTKRVCKNQKRAENIWVNISFIILFLILFSLLFPLIFG